MRAFYDIFKVHSHHLSGTLKPLNRVRKEHRIRENVLAEDILEEKCRKRPGTGCVLLS